MDDFYAGQTLDYIRHEGGLATTSRVTVLGFVGKDHIRVYPVHDYAAQETIGLKDRGITLIEVNEPEVEFDY